MELNIIEPKVVSQPLIGREYEFGVRDCFEVVRDYYKTQDIDLPKRALFEDDWWDRGLNYFCTDYIASWGFKEVTGSLLPNDLIVFTMGAKVGNHCGVYLGQDVFLHHAYERLSCRENLYPIWQKHITGVYRHET